MNQLSVLSNLKSPSTGRTRRHRRIGAALLIYSIVGFFIAPAIVKSQLLKRLPALTHRQAAVQKVRMNPYALSLTIRGLSLTETNGQPFAGFDEFHINFQLSSLFRWAWTFSEIRLVQPTANIIREPGGGFNFADLISPESNPPPVSTHKPKSLPVVLVQHLVVTNGNFNFTDHTRVTPFHIHYGPANLDLKNLTTRRKRDGQYSFAVTTPSGGDFDWSGTISANPPESSGKFSLRGFALKTYSPYLDDFVRAQVTDGLLDVAAEYRFSAEASPLELDITNAGVNLTGFHLETANTNELLLAFEKVAVSGASFTLSGRAARIPSVKVHGGSLFARRENDGQLNWLKLIVAKTNAASTSVDSETNLTTPWKVVLDDLNVENFSVTAVDKVPPTPAQLGFDDLRVNVKGVSNQSNAPLTAAVEFNWRSGGTVRVEANGTLLPPAVEAKLAVDRLGLSPIQPYVEQQASLVLNNGDFTLHGRARYTPDGSPGSLIQFTGDMSIAKFASIDTIAYHDFVRWEEFSVRGINFALQTNALSVDEVKFTGLQTSLVVSSNGQLALQALIKQPRAEASTHAIQAEESPTIAPAAFPVRVAALVFDKCSFLAADQSLTPHFETSIEEFSGTIRDITWPGLTRAGVDIRGKASALAPFEVRGSVMPDATNPFVDLKLTMKNEDLTSFTPYTEKFVGHPLNRGKLSFDLNYRIENRKLEAANVIAIDQFTFGPRNDSTNATKLPVKLAIALLKDRNGRIDLDLPVTGSMDDPQFSIGGLVWRAIANILLKAATSPFSLLGAMFGGSEELQYVDFAPGSATLEAAQTNKLDTLAKALYERPALSLEISASGEPADREMISRQKLGEAMKTRRLQEWMARGKPIPGLNAFQLDPADYERLLRQAYKESFNMTPERALRKAREALVLDNAPSEVAAVPNPGRSKETLKGATQLMQEISGGSRNTTSRDTPATSTVVPAKPKTEAELVLEEMERRLMSILPATEDDLRNLMKQRSLAVQKFLLDTGKVAAERIFVVSQKLVDPDVKGAARATFSLN